MAIVQLSNLDARLAYLSLQYHLARPGSELDQASHGLTEVAQALEPQLRDAIATIELSDYQGGRLVSAISGTMNELKTYPLLDPLPAERGGGRHTAVPTFDAILLRLFPEVEKEPEGASELVVHLMALRRRLQNATGESTSGDIPLPQRRRWWRFWEHEGDQR